MSAGDLTLVQGSVSQMIQRLQRGEGGVTRELFNVYFSRLKVLGRARLAVEGRRVSDESDLAMEVLTSFLLAATDGKLPELQSREDVWRLLAARLNQRAVNHHQHAARLRRGGGKVRGESALQNEPGKANGTGMDRLTGREPSPVENLIQAEELQQLSILHTRLIDSLENPKLKEIAMLILDGVSPEAIGQRVDLSRASVYRKLALIKDRWQSVEIESL